MEAGRKEPGTVIGEAMGAAFDPWPADHPLRHRDFDTRMRELKALKLDDVRAWHRDNYGTSEGQIAIVGDFDPDQIKPLLQKLFADWTPRVAYAPTSDPLQPGGRAQAALRDARQVERGVQRAAEHGAERRRPGLRGPAGGPGLGGGALKSRLRDVCGRRTA